MKKTHELSGWTSSVLKNRAVSNEAARAIPPAATIATVGRGELRRAMSADWVPLCVRNYWLFTGALYRLMIWNLEFGCYHVTSPWIFLEDGRSPLLFGWNRSNIGYILFWFLCFNEIPHWQSKLYRIYIWIATCESIQDIFQNISWVEVLSSDLSNGIGKRCLTQSGSTSRGLFWVHDAVSWWIPSLKMGIF